MEKKINSILKNVRFSGKGYQSLHIRINIMRIRKMLISCVKLDHALYSINYSAQYLTSEMQAHFCLFRTVDTIVRIARFQ